MLCCGCDGCKCNGGTKGRGEQGPERRITCMLGEVYAKYQWATYSFKISVDGRITTGLLYGLLTYMIKAGFGFVFVDARRRLSLFVEFLAKSRSFLLWPVKYRTNLLCSRLLWSIWKVKVLHCESPKGLESVGRGSGFLCCCLPVFHDFITFFFIR